MKQAIELAREAELPFGQRGAIPLWDKELERLVALARADERNSWPAQQEPVAFPARKAVEREIERTTSPTGMHLNDGKERVALPGGTLRHMLALIDRTPPAQRPWVGLNDEEIIVMSRYDLEYAALIGEVQRKLKDKNT